MELSPVEIQGTEATSSLAERFAFDAMSLIQLAVLGIVALILGLFVVRPILTGRAAEARQAAPALAAPGQAETAGAVERDRPDLPALDGEIDDDVTFEAPTLADFGFDGAPTTGGSNTSDAVARLRQLIEERREETVGVLRSWMEDSGDRA